MTALARATKTYANDGSYESIEGQLIKLAIKFHKRMLALKIPMDIEDVKQELRVSYLLARKCWDPEKAKFTTYFQWSATNNWNARIEKLVRERTELGMYSYDSPPANEDGEDFGDPLDVMANLEADVSPSDRLDAAANMRATFAGASQGCRRLMAALLAAETRGDGPPPRLRDLCKQIGLEGDELRQVKHEILKKFGVRWNN